MDRFISPTYRRLQDRGSDTETSPSVNPSFPESMTSPSVRSNSLSPAVRPRQNQDAPGPASPDPQPQAHPHQPSPQSYPPPFAPAAMRNPSGGSGPRSPSLQRAVPNDAGGRPPVNTGAPDPSGSNMPSPRVAPSQPHVQHQHQHQKQPAPVQGMMPMQPAPGWPGYYYPYVPGAPMQAVPPEHYMHYPPQHWHMRPPQRLHQPPSGATGPPQTPLTHTHGLPMPSPRPLQTPLQGPGTPPAGSATPLPSAGPRLNSSASASASSHVQPPQQRQSRTRITDASGHELDLTGLRKLGMAPSSTAPTSASASDKSGPRTSVRLETEEALRKRIAEEERRQKEKEKEKEEQEWKKRHMLLSQHPHQSPSDTNRELQTLLALSLGLPTSSPRLSQPPLQASETPSEGMATLLPSAGQRSNSNAGASVPSHAQPPQQRQSRVKIVDGSGHEVDLTGLCKQGATLSSDKNVLWAIVRSEAPIPIAKRRFCLNFFPVYTSASSQPLPSALATARHIQDVYQVPYPEGIKSPKPELNRNAKDGEFRYDREFLLQFMSVCKEKPDNLPPLEAIGCERVDRSHTMGRSVSGRRGIRGSMSPPSVTAQRRSSIGLNFNLNSKVSSSFAMGNLAALKRTRTKRSDATGDKPNCVKPLPVQSTATAPTPLEPISSLEHSADGCMVDSMVEDGKQVKKDSPESVEKEVRALLRKLSVKKFESISSQVIAWANRSENEKDGRTLIRVVRIVIEEAANDVAQSEVCARLCRKMMEQISPNVMDESIRDAEGKPITGGLLFRKYLLNRCQEDFERGWSDKETTAAAALVKANEDQAVKNANEKNKDEGGEVILYSDEYYAAQKAKRQGLGLIKFIGELFKLRMLTERIMHECIKKLLSNVDNPEEEEIESLCKLLTTVGQSLDTSKARGHMDVYFSRMKELAKSSNVSSRMQFMLQDVIELRERKWIPRNASQAPTTLAQVHETAAKEKAQQEQQHLRSAMSRGGSRRGHDRDGNAQAGLDGWAVASGPSRPSNKAGDLTNFGKIQKGGGGATVFGPASVFTKKGDSKRDSASLSRVNSNTNMFQMLESASNEPAATTSSRASRSASRTTSVDLTHNPPTEPATPAQRPKLNLLPRTRPLHDKSESSPAGSRAEEEAEEGEIVERDSGRASMSKEQAEKRIDQDRKEFFAVRDLDEGEEYFSALPSEYRHILVQKLVLHALEAKEADAKLVASLFERAISRNLCSPASFEKGFLPAAEALDDIAIDAPKAFSLMAIMMKGAKLDEERRMHITSKSMDSERLLDLLSPS